MSAKMKIKLYRAEFGSDRGFQVTFKKKKELFEFCAKYNFNDPPTRIVGFVNAMDGYILQIVEQKTGRKWGIRIK